MQELTRSNTARKLGIDNTPPQHAIDNLHALVEYVLDPLREAWHSPIMVTSGYRCPALNHAVGGVPRSQHTLGQAADVTVGSQAGNKRLYALFQALHLPIDQAINEYGFQWLHLSYGPRHRRHYFEINL